MFYYFLDFKYFLNILIKKVEAFMDGIKYAAGSLATGFALASTYVLYKFYRNRNQQAEKEDRIENRDS
jgi:hypothetical protein